MVFLDFHVNCCFFPVNFQPTEDGSGMEQVVVSQNDSYDMQEPQVVTVDQVIQEVNDITMLIINTFCECKLRGTKW